MMKLSVQTAPVLDIYGIDAGFGMIADAGFDCVDFNIDHTLPGGSIRAGKLEGFFTQTDAQMREAMRPYAQAAKAHGVGFGQAHAPFPTYVHGAQKTNEFLLHAIKKTMMLLGEVQCPWLIVHPNFNSYSERLSPEEEWRLNEEFYAALIPAIRETGVRVCTENMFSSYKRHIIEAVMSDFEFAAAFVDHMNELAGEELFGFCLDVGHAALLHRDQRKVINTMGRRITTLHLHDNDGQNDQHLFPYEGIIDWDAVCTGLKDVGYQGTLSFETFNAIATRAEGLAPELLKLLAAIGRRFREKIEG
ncbi:MAG: sugar phosphate isomerase/epimerase [Eubacteriales bacterium]|nr:sugar phosphate isomerase/epimerase [Eubacteriales bacterium]